MVDTRRRHITVAIDQDLLERARGRGSKARLQHQRIVSG